MKKWKKNAMNPHQWAKITLFFTLAGCLYLAASPLPRFFAAQSQAKKVFRKEVQRLYAQLPPPNSPDLSEKMPLHLNGYVWRQGFQYYPKRHAFKYTFAPTYRGIHKNLSIPEPLELPIPEPLERRSVWFQAAGNQWKCYAGVKKRVRGNLCNDVQIIRGLKEEEHQQAQIFPQTSKGATP